MVTGCGGPITRHPSRSPPSPPPPHPLRLAVLAHARPLDAAGSLALADQVVVGGRVGEVLDPDPDDCLTGAEVVVVADVDVLGVRSRPPDDPEGRAGVAVFPQVRARSAHARA